MYLKKLKQLVLLVIIAVGLAVFGILTAISGAVARTQTTQYSAKYWDPDGRYSMVSVFLPKDNRITQNKVQQLEYTLDQALVKEAIEALKALSNAIKLEGDIEALIKAKTGGDCVVIINNNSAEVIVAKGALNDTVILQIKEIVLKQTGFSAENITIVELSS